MDLAGRLLRDGYRAIERDRAARRGAATYATRMLGRRAVVLGGRSGAALFYDEDVVERKGAVPPPVAWLLFGRGAVHGLDDHAHRERKQLFRGVLTARAAAECAELVTEELDRALTSWEGRERSLHDELVRAYGTAVLRWAGVPCSRAEATATSRQYAKVVDGFGLAGPAYLRAWQARHATDTWARTVVAGVRHGRTTTPTGSPLAVIAASDLDDRTAAVELGNLLRPTIAVSWLGTWAALELVATSSYGERLLGTPEARWRFAQEVRRTTPFVPALAGRVRRSTVHEGVAVRRGERVVLDVRGIDLDPDLHPEPGRFSPERFEVETPGPFDLVPQGGGLPEGHRCPGEDVALQVLTATLDVLRRAGLVVARPPRVDLSRIPALPDDGLRVRAGVGHMPVAGSGYVTR